ncbi:MAG: hypothetical protein KC416_06195, partial [Myxococcales bacterium]|nr:hypothetical protein [Myxococcales bacterium]
MFPKHFAFFPFVVGVFLALGAILAPALAQAQGQGTEVAPADDGKVRIVVNRFSGARAARIRAHVVAALGQEPDFVVLPLSDVTDGKSLGVEDYGRASKEAEVDIVIEGTVKRRPRWSATVKVVQAWDGLSVGEKTWSVRTLRGLSVVRKTAAVHLGDPIRRATAGRPKEDAWYETDGDTAPIPAAEIVTEDDEESVPVAGAERYDWLRVAVVGGTLHRSLSAEAEVINNGRQPGGPATLTENRSYKSAGIGHGEVGLSAEFYPL